MKRRIITIGAALVLMLSLIAMTAQASPPPPPSQVAATGYSGIGNNISAAGSQATFIIAVTFPELDPAGFTEEQLRSLEVTMGDGSAFSFSNGRSALKTLVISDAPDKLFCFDNRLTKLSMNLKASSTARA